MPLSETKEIEPTEVARGTSWIGWLPISVLPLIAVACRNLLPPWVFMWVLSFAIYLSLKWLTWWRARSRIAHAAWRSVPRSIAQGEPLLRGWAAMLGLILLLHFGTFQIVALLWQSVGVDAKAIMSAPLRSTSLGEFWGRRWNLGFRQLSHELIFRPLHRRLGTDVAGFLVFAVSGLTHDLVISVPARGGYGLPTLYFLLQGTGMTIEHSRFGKRLGLGSGVRGWCFMMVFLAAPVFWLFHPWFVLRVILPFMQAIHAL